MVYKNEEKIKKIKEGKAWADRKLKGSMAECIVEEMLRDAGYEVYKFGYEMVLQHLKGVRLEDNYVKRIITTMPDFIIVDKNNCPNFLEVKYRKDGNLNLSKDKLRIANLGKDWAESRLMVVSLNEPHFHISRVKEFVKSGKLFSLENEKFIKVNKEIIKRYGYLVRKYFLEKKSEIKSNKIPKSNYHKKLEKTKEKYLNAYENWTSEADEKIKKLYVEGKSNSELSEIFKRKPGAIRSRLKKLGLVK